MGPNVTANFSANFSELQLRQLDAALDRWRSADLRARPPSGGLKAIRQAMGVPATHLARHLNRHPARRHAARPGRAGEPASPPNHHSG